MAVIGFLSTNLTIFEGEGTLIFTIGVLQGYLDIFVSVLFTTETSSAKGSDLNTVLPEPCMIIMIHYQLVQTMLIPRESLFSVEIPCSMYPSKSLVMAYLSLQRHFLGC